MTPTVERGGLATTRALVLLDPKRCEQSGDPGEWDVREIGDLASKDLYR